MNIRNRLSGDCGEAGGLSGDCGGAGGGFFPGLIFGGIVTAAAIAIPAWLTPDGSVGVRIACPEGARSSLELFKSPAAMAIASCINQGGTGARVTPKSVKLTQIDADNPSNWTGGHFIVTHPEDLEISQSVNPDGTPGNVIFGVTGAINLDPAAYSQPQPVTPSR